MPMHGVTSSGTLPCCMMAQLVLWLCTSLWALCWGQPGVSAVMREGQQVGWWLVGNSGQLQLHFVGRCSQPPGVVAASWVKVM